LNLSLPHHVHNLISPASVRQAVSNAQGAHAWFHQPFDKAVVLFDQVVEIFALSAFTRHGEITCSFQFAFELLGMPRFYRR
jgi:hypothetical protein